MDAPTDAAWCSCGRGATSVGPAIGRDAKLHGGGHLAAETSITTPAMSNTRLVYSTGQGRLCPECGRPLSDCRCKRSKPAAPQPQTAVKTDGIVRVGRETKGRKGKGVTVITGVPLTDDALGEMATRLKKRCGSGGTVHEGVIEIQGDHRDTLVAELTKLGYTVRRVGG